MVFTTPIFLFAFLPLAIVLEALARHRMRTAALTALSLVFYGWWRPDFVLLMVFSSTVDFVAGRR
ncbi:MAG: MBOAT family protein, partial [Planctomycetota bacterium]